MLRVGRFDEKIVRPEPHGPYRFGHSAVSRGHNDCDGNFFLENGFDEFDAV